MGAFLSWVAVGGLAGLLAAAVYTDLTSRRIPNWLTLAVAILVVPYWVGSGAEISAIQHQLGVTAAAVLVFGMLWQAGHWLKRPVMGGGDVKLLMALALWLPALVYLDMLFWMAVAGALISAAMLAHQHWKRPAAPLPVPYGVAIAAATFGVFGEQIVKQFPA